VQKIVKKIDIEISLDDLDENNIGSILRTYNELIEITKAIEKKINMLTDKLKYALKERKWESFKDEISKISVSVSTKQQEKVNKKALKMLLNDEQYNQVVTKSSSERLLVITPADRERLKKYGKHK
jgi:hypothetical protein